MAQVTRLVLVLLLVLSGPVAAHAALVRDQVFENWLQDLQQEAVNVGISPTISCSPALLIVKWGKR